MEDGELRQTQCITYGLCGPVGCEQCIYTDRNDNSDDDVVKVRVTVTVCRDIENIDKSDKNRRMMMVMIMKLMMIMMMMITTIVRMMMMMVMILLMMWSRQDLYNQYTQQ